MSIVDKNIPDMFAPQTNVSTTIISELTHKDDFIASTDTSQIISSVVSSDDNSFSENTDSNSQSESGSSGVVSSSDDSSDSDSDITSSDEDISGQKDDIDPKGTQYGMGTDRIDRIALTVAAKVSSERNLDKDISATTRNTTQNITVESMAVANSSRQPPTVAVEMPTPPLPKTIPSDVVHLNHAKSKSLDFKAPLILPYALPTPTEAVHTSYDTETIGWGDVVEPAPWEWKSMPLDCSGILEEQRRTVFYEFRDKGNGEGEWIIPKHQTPPNYHGIHFLKAVTVDSEWEYRRGKLSPKEERMRGRGDKGLSNNHRVSSVHALSPRDQPLPLLDESCLSTLRLGSKRGGRWARGGRGARGTRGGGRLYQPPPHTRSHSKTEIPLEPSAEVEMSSTSLVRPIIDIPNDPFDTAGLISPNPSRPSLPIVESKGEMKKFSAWTKEGKREREMSSLILPRPEKITMPAAIYPQPTKLGGRNVRVTKADGTPEKGEKIFEERVITVLPVQTDSTPIEEPVTEPVVVEITPSKDPDEESTPPQKPAEYPPSVAPATTAPLDAAQLLLQLVNLLRADDNAMGALKSIVNSLNPNAPTDATETKPVDPTHLITPSDVVAHGSRTQGFAAPTEKLVEVALKEHLVSRPVADVDATGSYVTKSPEVSGSPNREIEPISVDKKPLHTTCVAHPLKEHGSSKDKHKSHGNSSKSRPKKHSKHTTVPVDSTIDTPISCPSTQVTRPTIPSPKDEDLTSDEAWYQVPEAKPLDSDDEFAPRNSLKLEDIKSPSRPDPGFLNHNPTGNADPQVNRALKYHAAQEHRRTRMRSRSPPEKKGYGPVYGSSEDAYRRNFPSVDAEGDLRIESAKKGELWVEGRDGLGGNIELKSSQMDPVAISDLSPILSTAIGKGKEVEDNAGSISSSGTALDTPTKQIPNVPVLYDFNPPSPRRVTRRVVLSSKDTSTQTSPPRTPSRDPDNLLVQSTISPTSHPENLSAEPSTETCPRREAIHHAHYYHTLPCDSTPRASKDHHTPSKRSKSKHEKKPCPYTAETLPEVYKRNTGSDLQAMENLKNVDAKDDLMIVSKPREQSPQVGSPTVIVGKNESEMVIPQVSAGPSDRIVGVETSALYALLTAPKNEEQILPPTLEDEPPIIEKKHKKDKHEKKDKKEKKEKKDKKDKSKSRHKPKHHSQTDTPSLPIHKEIPDVTGNGDILVDLIGDEIPNGKWSILNPTSP